MNGNGLSLLCSNLLSLLALLAFTFPALETAAISDTICNVGEGGAPTCVCPDDPPPNPTNQYRTCDPYVLPVSSNCGSHLAGECIVRCTWGIYLPWDPYNPVDLLHSECEPDLDNGCTCDFPEDLTELHVQIASCHRAAEDGCHGRCRYTTLCKSRNGRGYIATIEVSESLDCVEE